MPAAPPPDPLPAAASAAVSAAAPVEGLPADLAEADAWLRRLFAPELEALQDFCDLLLFSLPELGASRQAYVERLADPAAGTLAKLWAGLLNGLARQAARSPEAALRRHAVRALGVARRKLAQARALLDGESEDGPESVAWPGPGPDGDGDPAWADCPGLAELAALDDREFVLRGYEAVLGRGCRPSELQDRLGPLAAGGAAARVALARGLSGDRRVREAVEAGPRSGGGAEFHVMGSGRLVRVADWDARRQQLAADPAAAAPVPPPALTRWRPRRLGRPLVSVLTSVYRGGAYIEAFLDNLTGQLGFGEDIELIVVDAASPEGEAEAVASRARSHPSIRLLRCERPLGIYAAWNLALAEARGDYLTNANVDDLRREDSLAVQAAALDRWPEVDVVYQDFFYTMDPRLPYAEVAALGWRSALPDALNPELQMGSNPPHHAPMWRARLHRDLGPFDASFQSAGDYEFWLRCLADGRRFRKIADPHAVYFQNPAGLSTRPGSRGHAETRRALRRHGRRLLALHETLALARFP